MKLIQRIIWRAAPEAGKAKSSYTQTIITWLIISILVSWCVEKDWKVIYDPAFTISQRYKDQISKAFNTPPDSKEVYINRKDNLPLGTIARTSYSSQQCVPDTVSFNKNSIHLLTSPEDMYEVGRHESYHLAPSNEWKGNHIATHTTHKWLDVTATQDAWLAIKLNADGFPDHYLHIFNEWTVQLLTLCEILDKDISQITEDDIGVNSNYPRYTRVVKALCSKMNRDIEDLKWLYMSGDLMSFLGVLHRDPQKAIKITDFLEMVVQAQTPDDQLWSINKKLDEVIENAEQISWLKRWRYK